MTNLSDYNLINLTAYLGDVKTVDAICYIWNLKHFHDRVYIKDVSEETSTITLSGVCSNEEELLDVCRYLTTVSVAVRYEKTYVQVEV